MSSNLFAANFFLEDTNVLVFTASLSQTYQIVKTKLNVFQ